MDNAEYKRLTDEMAADAKWQLQLFTFAVTGSAAVLTLLSAKAGSSELPTAPGVPMGLFFLAPLVVIIPSSLMILNRARTRNRKAAFIVTYLDYERLCERSVDKGDKVDELTPLPTVRTRADLPWETALQLLHRSYESRGRRIHLAPALVFMFLGFLAIEGLCVTLAYFTLREQPWITMTPKLGALAIAIVLVSYRVYLLLPLAGEESIQGFVRIWLELRTDTDGGRTSPAYLREWIEECVKSGKLKPRPTETGKGQTQTPNSPHAP